MRRYPDFIRAASDDNFAPAEQTRAQLGRRLYENTEFSTSRDIEAIQIPAGTKITIPAERLA